MSNDTLDKMFSKLGAIIGPNVDAVQEKVELPLSSRICTVLLLILRSPALEVRIPEYLSIRNRICH